MLPTQQDIWNDEANVVVAQTALDGFQAKLTADQALIDAATPHLSVLAELEAYGEKLAEEAKAGFSELIAKAKGLF